MAKNNHIIRRQAIEINFGSMDTGMGMQNRIAALFYERLQPKMEILFDELADSKHTMEIDSLEIDCGLLAEKNWEETWVDSVLRQLKDKLLAGDRKQISVGKTDESFFYFLEEGTLPWNSSIESVQSFEKEIVFDESFLIILQQTLQQENAVKRLLSRFSEKFIAGLIRALTSDKEKERKAGEPAADTKITIVQSLPLRKQQEIILRDWVKETINPPGENNDMQTSVKKDPAKKGIANTVSAELFINNAGLIILHPFLPALFEHLQLTEKNKWIDDAAQHSAVQITNFLVTGETHAAEFDLSLNKILCGLQPGDVLLETPAIDAETQKACGEMIREIIKLWASLKNTGVDSFRETFLQRNGKLTHTGHEWRLQVEQKAFDVLLNSLPWGIGVIKLPWMKDIMHTEWNS